MPRREPRARPSARLRIGEIVLARAALLDTERVAAPLERFRGFHERYVGAQHTVEECHESLRAARLRVHQRNLMVDDSVERLAGALAMDGLPRRNPFTVYMKIYPSVLARMAMPRKERTIRTLLRRVRRDRRLSERSLHAASAVERAIETLDEARADLPAIEVAARRARLSRDAVGHLWDRAFAALRSSVQLAAPDDPSHLHEILFRKPFPRYQT